LGLLAGGATRFRVTHTLDVATPRETRFPAKIFSVPLKRKSRWRAGIPRGVEGVPPGTATARRLDWFLT